MAALCIIALTIGSSALLRMAVCMLLMVVIALLSVLFALFTVKVRFSASRNRIERMQSLPYQVEVRFISVFPVGKVMLYAEGANALRIKPIPFVKTIAQGERTFMHRGVYSAFSGRLCVEDMFGFFRLSRSIAPTNMMITVLPRIKPAQPLMLDSGENGPEVKRRYPDDQNSPSGVREWRDGDLIKRIHWKLTMKTYDPSLKNLKPIVRTYDEAARPDVIVLPDMMRLDAVEARAKRIEDAICESSLSLIAAQLETDNPVRMLIHASTPNEVEGAGAFDIGIFQDALAIAQFDGEEPYEQLLTEASKRLDRTGAMILITSRLTLRVADAVIRLRRMTGMMVSVVWITDTRKAEAEALLSRLEAADVMAKRENPFRDEET